MNYVGIGRLFEEFRVLRKWHIKALVERLSKDRTNPFGTTAKPTLAKKLTELEAGKLRNPDPNEQFLTAMANLYDVPSVMLDPFYSHVIDAPGIVQKITDFERSGFGTRKRQNSRGVYTVARHVLKDSNVDFIRVELGPSQQSATHWHPGDEFLFVRKGQIEIQLANNGLRTTLRKGDYIHFYAEQTHTVFNRSGTKVAELFIIRFHRLMLESTRNGLLKSLAEIREGLNHARNMKRPFEQIYPLIVQLAQTPIPDFNLFKAASYQPKGVVDPTRIALALNKQSRFIPNRLGGRIRANKVWLSAHQLRKIQRGEIVSELTVQHLSAIAKRLRVPAVLFYSSLFPRIPGFVVVRRPDDFYPLHLAKGLSKWTGANYSVPIRNLACSDIDIAILELAPKASCPFNQHAGFELLLPLAGQIKLSIHEEKKQPFQLDASAKRTEYIHFKSQGRHKVCNPSGRERAKLMVIRFFEPLGWKKKSQAKNSKNQPVTGLPSATELGPTTYSPATHVHTTFEPPLQHG